MRHFKTSFAALAAAVSLTTFASVASAQQTGFAIDRFEPAERGSQFFVNDTLDLRGNFRPALGATFDYAYKPLVVYQPGAETERTSLVRHQLFAQLGGSMVLFDRLRLGLNVPVALWQDGDNATVNGTAFKAADKAAIGDIRLAADVRLLGEYGQAFTLAAGVRAWLPTGVRSQFTSDGSFRIAPQVMAAGDLGIFTYSARVAFMFRVRDDNYAGSSLGSELNGAAGVGIKTLDDKLVIGPEFYASTVVVNSDAFFKTRGTPVDWLFGVHYDVVDDVRIGAGAGSGLSRGYGSPEFRALLSAEWAPAYHKPDRDGDKIPDETDACPDVPGIPDPDPKKNGCPPPPPDADRDGIPDATDACPNEPGPRTDDPLTNGCPDKDADGIPDKVDACPDVPGVKDQDPKRNGCPPDKDGDGIADTVDACPDVPGVKDQDPKRNGCPPDKDGDGILDVDDACPDAPGVKDPDPKKNGCPLVMITEKEIKIYQEVKFKFDSAVILPESDTILTAVKTVFVEHPDLKKIRVEGHTDNKGQPAYNKALSQKRAASVVKWLTDHGVEKARLISEGFGQEKPIDTNETDAGRANNRRVAFTIVDRTPAPAKTEVAPSAVPDQKK